MAHPHVTSFPRLSTAEGLVRREKFFNSEAGHRISTVKPVTQSDLAIPVVTKQKPRIAGLFIKR